VTFYRCGRGVTRSKGGTDFTAEVVADIEERSFVAEDAPLDDGKYGLGGRTGIRRRSGSITPAGKIWKMAASTIDVYTSYLA
jgi:hypothetical protein